MTMYDFAVLLLAIGIWIGIFGVGMMISWFRWAIWRIGAFCVVGVLLNGCAGLPMALSAAGGAFTIAKDVLDIDVSLRQLTPGKTPIAQIVPALPPIRLDPYWLAHQRRDAESSGHDE